MTDFDNDDPVLLLAESVVALSESQRGHNDTVTLRLRELVDALRAAPAPVVNIAAPEAPVVNVAPAEVRVMVPDMPAATVTVNVPDRQTVDIASMPKARIRVVRGRDGRITELEVI